MKKYIHNKIHRNFKNVNAMFKNIAKKFTDGSPSDNSGDDDFDDDDFDSSPSLELTPPFPKKEKKRDLEDDAINTSPKPNSTDLLNQQLQQELQHSQNKELNKKYSSISSQNPVDDYAQIIEELLDSETYEPDEFLEHDL